MPTHLKTWEVCEPQLDLILVEEVLGHGALHRLPVLQLQREALHLRGPPRHVTHAVLPAHAAAVRDLDLQTLDLLGELHPLRVGQRLSLLVDVSDVQNLAHELDDWLSLVEGSGRHVDVEHHLPLGRPHRLVETKPDFPTTSQRMVIPIWGGEEGPSDRGVGHAGKVPHHHVQRLNGVKRNLPSPAFKSLFQGIKRDLRVPLHRHPEYPVLSFTGQSHVQLD